MPIAVWKHDVLDKLETLKLPERREKHTKKLGARMKVANTSGTRLRGSNRRYSEIDKIK